MKKNKRLPRDLPSEQLVKRMSRVANAGEYRAAGAAVGICCLTRGGQAALSPLGGAELGCRVEALH